MLRSKREPRNDRESSRHSLPERVQETNPAVIDGFQERIFLELLRRRRRSMIVYYVQPRERTKTTRNCGGRGLPPRGIYNRFLDGDHKQIPKQTQISILFYLYVYLLILEKIDMGLGFKEKRNDYSQNLPHFVPGRQCACSFDFGPQKTLGRIWTGTESWPNWPNIGSPC